MGNADPEPQPDTTGKISPSSDIRVFLIADVRGYTTYTYEHHDEDAAQLAVRFATIAESAVQVHGGQVLEVRGDEVLAIFSSARASLRAAIALQVQVEQASRTSPEQPIRCGIGVEAGEAVPVAAGYRGLAINLAARLCSQAGPGEVLAGEIVIGLARKVEGLHFRDMGLVFVKGVAEPVRITQVLAAEAPHMEPNETAEETETRHLQPEDASPVLGEREPTRVSSPLGNFLSAQPRHRLVAREAEMAVLVAALEAVQAGTGRLVFVVGEPGVGKTRLAQEVLQAAQDHGFLVVSGRCYAPQETVPYYPFLEVLARAYTVAPPVVGTALPQRWPEVGRLIPDLRGREGAFTGPSSGGAVDQQRLFWQVTHFLQTLAEDRPLALLVDDLHWMDGASLNLLLHLARNTRGTPILLLGTYRDSEVPWPHPLAKSLQDLSRDQLVEQIELQQLSKAGIAALLAVTLGEGEVSGAVTDTIYGPTQGNAFFAQEILRALVERGDIALVNGCWQPRAGADIIVPQSVRAAVLERVGRLSPKAQETLGLASVLGQTFRFDDLLTTSTLVSQTLVTTTEPQAGAGATASVITSLDTTPEATLEAVLDEAVGVRVLREVDSSRYAFSHALAQRAVYEQLSARRRRRLHRAIAESLEALPEAERTRLVTDIAYHLLQAEEQARALPYVLQAGEQAKALYAYTEAEQEFRTALGLARQVGDVEAASLAQEQLGYMLFWKLQFEDAFSMLEQAAAEAERRGDLTRLVRLAWTHTLAAVHRGSPTEGIARLLSLTEITKMAGASSDLMRLYFGLAYRYQWSGQYAEQLDAVEHAVQVAQAVGDAGLIAEARRWYGAALTLVGRLDEARVELTAALPVLEKLEGLDYLLWQAVALTRLGIVLTHLGHIAEARTHFARSVVLGEQMKDQSHVAWNAANRALTAFVSGDWSAADSYIERAVALRPFLDTSPFFDCVVYEVEAQLQVARGQLDAATHSAEAQLALAEKYSILQHRRGAQRLLAELALQMNDPARACARLLPLLDRAGLVELEVNELLPMVVRAQLELGEVEAAEALATQTVARLRTQHDHLTLVEALRTEAAVWIQQQRWEEAESALTEALQLSRQMPYPYAEAKALSTYADLLVDHGQLERAREQYDTALAILRSLGEVPYAKRIERALAEMKRP
jgi:predicted ATPase/class 3 adenylate cyclase